MFRRYFKKLVEWLDLPPARVPEGTSEIHWEFLGDLLGDLCALSDEEYDEMLNQDTADPVIQRQIIDNWIVPAWSRFTDSSRTRILDTLNGYLLSGSEKLSWIFPSFDIPIRAKATEFFSLAGKVLSPETTREKRAHNLYRENSRQAFANTLFAAIRNENLGWLPENMYPKRHGIILPCDLKRHDPCISLESLRLQAATGLSPQHRQGLPCDAARWTATADTDGIMQMAAARFSRQTAGRLGVSRITLYFSHIVGEGYLAGHPEQLVKTRQARCIVDRLGFLVRCYPVLRA